MEGGLFIVERGADLSLSIGATFLGIVFLFLAAFGWGRTILQHKLPQERLARTLTLILLAVTFLVALFPFSFLSQEVRAQALLPANRAKAYAEVVGDFGTRLPVPLAIWRFDPDPIVIQEGGTSPQYVTVYGTQLLSKGDPTATFGSTTLEVVGSTNDSVKIDLSPVINAPRTANSILIRFGAEADSAKASVAVQVTAAEVGEQSGQVPPVQVPPVQAPIISLDSPDFTIVREQNAHEIYVIFGGAKFHVPTDDDVARYGGWEKVNVVRDGSLASIPNTPRDNTMLREASRNEVFVIQGGKRLWLLESELQQYGGRDYVRVVPDGALARNGLLTFIPKNLHDLTMIRELNALEVYVILDITGNSHSTR